MKTDNSQLFMLLCYEKTGKKEETVYAPKFIDEESMDIVYNLLTETKRFYKIRKVGGKI